MQVAYSYIRFSTVEQKKGDSLRRQAELSEKFASENGLTLDKSLHLQDLGLSAYDRSNVERGALGGFLEAIKLGRILPGSYLLVESLDRLSRAQVLDALEIFISILRQGVTIVTLADGMVYNTDSVGNNFGSLIISITIMARAHEESAMKSRRIKAAWKNKREKIAERKLTAQCPRWMRLNAEKSQFELITDRVNLVKEILELVKNGMGQAQIAKRLNERSIPPFSKHGKGWHPSYIQKIVTSPALYGEFQPNVWVAGKLIPHGDPAPNYYPTLISKEEYYLLQNIRSERVVGGAKAKKGTTVPNLLSGVVKCGYCGRSMILAGAPAMRVRDSDDKKPRRMSHKVLVCDGGRRGLGCYAVQWSYPDFEKSFLTFCRGLDLRNILKRVGIVENEHERQLTINEKLLVTNAAIDEGKIRVKNLLNALETGEGASTIVNRIRDREAELDVLVETKNKLEIELQTAKALDQCRTHDADSIQTLIQQMELLHGDDLFLVRVALAEHIRRLIEVVEVFPAGRLETPERIQRLRNELIRDGFSLERVEAHIAEGYQTEPKRQGRGPRGRYASRKEMGRYFKINAKAGESRVVYPDFQDPTKVIIELISREDS